ncbi:MAG TPA: DUF4910 domain-containing protein [Gemmatimonadaceae bacterium]
MGDRADQGARRAGRGGTVSATVQVGSAPGAPGARTEWDRASLAAALTEGGIGEGDVVFVHAWLERLGPLAGGSTEARAYEAVLGALGDVTGESGTVVVPTYTFSFCRREPFDVERTPTRGGPWSPTAGFLEWFRALPGAVRSRDPIHSVAALGARAEELVRDIPGTCFGAGSVFDRLHRMGGKIVMLGLPLEEATFRHHTEEMVGVPFRYRKLFTGIIREGGVERKSGWVYFVRALADAAHPDGSRLEGMARRAGVCRAVAVGAGELLAVDARAYHALTARAIAVDPWLTARGPEGSVVGMEEARVGARRFDVSLPERASMGEMIDALWTLPRDIVSDGYDAALRALAGQLPMTIHEYPAGTEAWSWIVPEKWTCHEAWLETVDGRRLFSYADHPLHVVSYSLPFEGEVTRDELLAHLHVHPMLDDAVPFIFKYYERDWGLCCSRRQRDALVDERYRVVIRTSSSYGTLKVGEVVVPGARDETFVLCAHLCHPHMVNDDLSGVVVGVEVMRALLARHEGGGGRAPRYTYRLIIVPETIGSLAWLSHNEALIPRMTGGLFLEMLGVDQPLALQLSFTGETPVDRACARVLLERGPSNWTGPFRSIVGNDERQFNAPGVRVPMLSLSRVVRDAPPNEYYPEYHSSRDTPETTSMARLEDARDAVLAMIDAIEGTVVPVPRFKGEVFCSRYGINIDPYANPEGYKAMFDIMYLIDGTRSVEDIARECGIAPSSVMGTLAELARHGLVTL